MSIAEKLTTIAENEQKVYNAGAKSEYDKFWDACQQNGNRVAYTNGFSGQSWTDETYNPKYEIVANSAAGVNALFLYSLITDVKVPVVLKNTTTQNTFASASIKRIPLIKLQGNVKFVTSFSSGLEYVRFEGMIENSIGFGGATKLDRGSIENIIGCLDPTVTGMTLTLSNTAVTNAFTEEEWENLISPYDNWTISRI